MRAIDLIIGIVVGVNAILGIGGWATKRFIRQRREVSHDAYQARLREQNEEIDRDLERLRER
jgi:hypothetical protein